MTGKELAEKALDIARNYKTVYMWGVFGSPVTESIIAYKAKQYPNWYTAAKQKTLRALIGKGYFAFDCVNLMKGIVWGWNGDLNAVYGGAKYATNGCPDTSADGMIALCKNVTTDFSGEIPAGAALWIKGHYGIYVGDGLAVECTNNWTNGVQITAVWNIGTKAGYNGRRWTKWGLLPFVTYEKQQTTTPQQTNPQATSAQNSYDVARNFDKALAGQYRCTASVLCARAGAGPTKKLVAYLKNGETVQCWGYYNTFLGTKWLLVQFTQGSKIYTAYASSNYLKKL